MVLVEPLAVKLDKFELPNVLQLKDEPSIVDAVNETNDETPLQTVREFELVIIGFGLMVIVIKLVSDLHPLAFEVATVL